MALGVLGLVMGEQRLWGVMNINIALDLLRIVLGGALIYAATQSDASSRTWLGVFGVVYLGAFVLGLGAPTLFGMLPHGLGSLDQLLHLGGGILGVALAMRTPSLLARR